MADHGAALGGGELTAQEALQETDVRMLKGMSIEMRGGALGVF
jgi:hypothetical protein